MSDLLTIFRASQPTIFRRKIMSTKTAYTLYCLAILVIILLLATWEDQPVVAPTPPVLTATPVVVTQTPVPVGMDAIQAEVVANATAGVPVNCSSASAIMAPAGCPFRPLPGPVPQQGP